MKKIIAVTMVALMMFAVATSAFAIVTETTAAYKNPPVFIDGMAVSDAWMSGLTAQNWKGSLTNQAYAEGSYIWFIAKVSVAADADTDAAHLWNVNGQTASLTITGKDNCLDFTSANMATLAQISGMSVTARQIQNNNLGIVEATAKQAKFTFTAVEGTHVDSNGVVLYQDKDLSWLELDAIYGKNHVSSNWKYINAAGGVSTVAVPNRATLQKDFYLHFMAITKASTEGLCVGTLKVNGEDSFERDVNVQVGIAATATAPGSYTTTGNWWAASGSTYAGDKTSATKLLPGDRSYLYLLYNTVNGKQYSIMKISNEALKAPITRNGYTVPGVANAAGPYTDSGSMYVLMNKEADKVVCAFVVDGSYRGLATYNKKALTGSDVSFNVNTTGRNAGYYMTVTSNDLSSSVASLNGSYNDYTMTTAELQAIFDFFGFAYANPRAPGDADFLARSGLVTVAEAKYNVANAVITTPDTNIVIPKTGDAATSTGLILVASAILAAAAVGFVLSKRAHN